MKDSFRKELKETKCVAYLLFRSSCDSTTNTEETPIDLPGTGKEGPTATIWSSTLS